MISESLVMARIVTSSGAFEQCMQTAILNGGGTFGTTSIPPYQSCSGEPYASSGTSTQEWAARQIYRSVNNLSYNCNSTAGNAEAWASSWAHQTEEYANWNGGWLDSIYATLGNPICTSPNNPTGCRAQPYPWPYSQLANVLIHEASHTHGYSHGSNGPNSNAQTACNRSGSWDYQTNTMPYLLGTCLNAVIATATSLCGPINSGCAGLRLVDPSGTSCMCVADPGWGVIGGTAGTIAASDYGIFAVYPGNGQIMRYASGSWSAIGGPYTQFVTNNNALYARDSSGVYRYSGSGTNWTIIGGPASQLIAGGTSLYAIDTSNSAIYQYNSSTNSWTAIGGGGDQFVASDTTLYARTSGGSSVVQYTGTPYSWSTIGGGSTNLVAGGATLYSIEPSTGNVYRHLSSTAWQFVGGPGAQFVANRTGLFGRDPSGHVTYKVMHNSTSWAPAGMALSELAGGGDRLIARHTSGDILLLTDSAAAGVGY